MGAGIAPATEAAVRTPGVTEGRWPAMGSTAHVIVVGGDPGLVEAARRRLAELEARWSRFRPDSEICRLRTFPGRPVLVSADTFRAVHLALEGHRRSGGLFDPTLGREMERLGYDRDRTGLWPAPGHGDGDPAGGGGVDGAPTDRSGPCRPPGAGRAARARGRAGRRAGDEHAARPGRRSAPSGAAGVRLDARARTILVPRGLALDLGGVGKGLAADIVVAELTESGATGACVNVGGDVCVAGDPPHPGGWSVAVDVEGRAGRPGEPPAGAPVLGLAGGGVATSSRRHRRWRHDGRDAHHVIDPVDGEPARSGLSTVAVAAANAGEAEILATAALVAGPHRAAEVIRRGGGTGLLVGDDGRVHTLPGWRELAR